jgi:PAS domain S-box-containing protein
MSVTTIPTSSPPGKLGPWVFPASLLVVAYGLLGLTFTSQLSHSEIMQRCVLVDPGRARIWSVGNIEIGLAYLGVFLGMLFYFLRTYHASRRHLADLGLALGYLLGSFILDYICVQAFHPFVALLIGDAIVMTFTVVVSRHVWFQRLLGVFVPVVFLTCAFGHFLEGLSYWTLTYTVNVPWTMVTADIGFAVLINASRYPAFIRGEEIVGQLAEARTQVDDLQTEIAERKKVEAELRRSEERYRRLINTAEEGIWITDDANATTFVNKKMARILGYTEEEMLGRSFFSFISADNEAIVPSSAQRRDEGGAEQYDVKFVRKDGTPIWTLVSSTPVFDERGEYDGILVMVTDITDRKLAEAELAVAYKHEHRIAEALQRSLLSRPSRDAFPDLEIETIYLPAFEDVQVGGDFYDQFPIADGKVALVVGDVSGKGLDAAARMAEAKFTLRAYLRDSTRPDHAMQRLNAFLCETQHLAGDADLYFICLTIVVVDCSIRKASLCVAGCEPPFLFRAPGIYEEIHSTGLPLGIVRDAAYETIELSFTDGDAIVIATDGIMEARRPGELFGCDGVVRTVEGALAVALGDASQDALKEVGRAILREAQAFAGGALSDDACILLVRHVSPVASAPKPVCQMA